jgi:hypothetical protein
MATGALGFIRARDAAMVGALLEAAPDAVPISYWVLRTAKSGVAKVFSWRNEWGWKGKKEGDRPQLDRTRQGIQKRIKESHVTVGARGYGLDRFIGPIVDLSP